MKHPTSRGMPPFPPDVRLIAAARADVTTTVTVPISTLTHGPSQMAASVAISPPASVMGTIQ